MSKAITLLGMGPSAQRRQAHIELDLIGEVWGVNNGYERYPVKYSRYFCLHDWENIKDNKFGVELDFDVLDNMGCPIYMTETLPVVRNQVRYPAVEIRKHFGTNFFLGSPSLMLMLALYEHDHGDTLSEIRTWGFDFMDGRHQQQKTSWAFWMSKAVDRKIPITGTGLAFFLEEDNDYGLRSLKEKMVGEDSAGWIEKAEVIGDNTEHEPEGRPKEMGRSTILEEPRETER